VCVSVATARVMINVHALPPIKKSGLISHRCSLVCSCHTQGSAHINPLGTCLLPALLVGALVCPVAVSLACITLVIWTGTALATAPAPASASAPTRVGVGWTPIHTV
jgi:hypothetical protein